MPVLGDAMYRVICRLELMRCRLLRWNRMEVGNLFRKVEKVEASITKLQLREDKDGGLSADDLRSL